MSLDRRSFVTGAGALAVTGAMVVLPKSANACKEHHEFFLHAEGLVVFNPMRPAVVSAYPGGMPPWLIGLLIGRVLDIFTITEINKGMLRAEVWVRRGPNYADAALQAALQGVPLQMQPPVPWPLSGIPISIFVVDIAEIHVKRHVTVTVADGQNAPYEKKTNQFIAIG